MNKSLRPSTVAAVMHHATAALGAWLRTEPYPPDDPVAAARAEVERMVCAVLGWTRLRLLTSLSDGMDSAAAARLQALVDARRAGQPLQYLLGEASFCGRSFVVKSGCLIPRPETELLVQMAADWVAREPDPVHALDLGTGSGCIAVTLALDCPQAHVVAVDISADAAAIAADNAARFGAKLDVLHSDGLDLLRALARRADGETGCAPPQVLVSNPPYIASADIAVLAREVREHEPQLALDGGPDGLVFYRAIRDVGPSFFAQGKAACFLEVGHDQGDPVLSLFQTAAWSDWTFRVVRDLRGVERIVWGEGWVS